MRLVDADIGAGVGIGKEATKLAVIRNVGQRGLLQLVERHMRGVEVDRDDLQQGRRSDKEKTLHPPLAIVAIRLPGWISSASISTTGSSQICA